MSKACADSKDKFIGLLKLTWSMMVLWLKETQAHVRFVLMCS